LLWVAEFFSGSWECRFRSSFCLHYSLARGSYQSAAPTGGLVGLSMPSRMIGPDVRHGALEAAQRLKTARSAHAHVRGTTAQFYDWLGHLKRGHLPEGPPVWICGDCHVGNLGPLAHSDGRVVIQISPFAARLSAEEARGVRYVRPELVAEVEFRAWTADGHLRHASFRGLREDKPAQEVTREASKIAAPATKPPTKWVPRNYDCPVLVARFLESEFCQP
jgi:hypothetical protein